MILFKKQFKEKILNGEKYTTIRKRFFYKKNNIIKTNLGINLYIEDIKKIKLSNITDAMALADGFSEKKSLINCLKDFYPGCEYFKLITFSLYIKN